MDAGKAISAMLTVGGNVEYYLEGVGTMDHPGSKVPFIAVPTTAGTGSEATKNAVISRTGISGYKRSLRHDNFVPDIAVVDPVLATGCPPEITAASGMDCFTQLNEAYLSDRSSLYTDALALEGLKAIRASLRKVCSDGSDLNARTEMAFAALTSGICLTNAGLGVIHGFASSIGGLYNIPHGVICGTLMALSNEITIRELRNKKNNQEAMWKYVRLGKLFIESEDKSDDFYIDGFISYLHELTEELGLPGLKQIGVNEKDMKYIVSETDNKNNPVKLNADDMEEILRRRF
jgi:alcohol dehydrogenase class IV